MFKIKSIFPTDKNEIELIKFINTYQYLSTKDLQYFFKTTYYPKRIAKLIQNNILRRYKKNLVLAEDGYNFIKMVGLETTKLRYQAKYATRLKFMSHLAAVLRRSNAIFTPSYQIKDKTVFTESSRKYIGVLKIFGTNYLTYHISSTHDDKYISAVMYDIQKELKYKNIIILINDISRIDFLKFSFGFNSVIICEDTDEALEKLKYLQQINWTKAIKTEFKENIFLSDLNFCDYTNNKDLYISCFYFVDTEKINKIDTFINNNIHKNVNIICPNSVVQYLKNKLPNCKFHVINIANFIEKEIIFYE